MSVVDASVWVSRFWPDDAFHSVSRNWLMQTTLGGSLLVAPTIALAEVSGAIARRTGDGRLARHIVQQIRQLPTLQLIAIDETLGQLSAEIAGDYQLRGTDAVYIAVASRLQLPLVSWDQEQLSRPAAIVKGYTPAERT